MRKRRLLRYYPTETRISGKFWHPMVVARARKRLGAMRYMPRRADKRFLPSYDQMLLHLAEFE